MVLRAIVCAVIAWVVVAVLFVVWIVLWYGMANVVLTDILILSGMSMVLALWLLAPFSILLLSAALDKSSCFDDTFERVFQGQYAKITLALFMAMVAIALGACLYFFSCSTREAGSVSLTTYADETYAVVLVTDKEYCLKRCNLVNTVATYDTAAPLIWVGDLGADCIAYRIEHERFVSDLDNG